jgi:phosphoribosylformylglycinamidine synthase subunit PurSL
MGGNLGMAIDLGKLPCQEGDRDDVLLFSESAGRFIVTLDPANREVFEKLFKGLPIACVGQVTEAGGRLVITGCAGTADTLISVPVAALKSA